MVAPRILIFAFAIVVLPVVFPQNPSQFTSIPSGGASGSPSFTFGERHLTLSSVGTLYSNSAFAHGFRHGYDEGFHIGDLDLQMGRSAHPFIKSKEYQQAGHEYNFGFGSKQLFRHGYQAGFRSGYTDAISGREFRASGRARVASEGLTTVLTPSRREFFDEGFSTGYESAQAHNAPAQNITADYVEQYCRNSGDHPLEYCSGFSRGYLFGIFGAAASDNKKSVSSEIAADR